MKLERIRIRFFIFFAVISGTALRGYSQITDLYINELQASSDSMITNPYTGGYTDWFELYNAGTTGVDISGFYLSDDPDNPMKWRISFNLVLQGGEYYLFWADGIDEFNHTNFKLGRAGEFIGLYDDQLNVIDSIHYSYQEDGLSYGRRMDNLQEWVFYEEGTPGYANAETYFNGRTENPVFSLTGGYYAGSVSVTLSTQDPSDRIYYTLDGTIPDETDASYQQPINIDTTTALRVRSFSDGKLPGMIKTQTYLINEQVNLPVVSLVTDPDNLFDDEIGIYVIGTNGRPGYCTDKPMNVNQDWERPVNVELYDVDGTLELNQRAGVKIFGGCSRTRYPQKSLALYARADYGKGSFDCQLFKDKPIYEFESFLLRNSADDCRYTMFKDAMGQAILGDMDIDRQAYRPAVVFINGQYWGIHNIREKINEHYPAGNYNLDVEDVHLLKRNPEQDWNIMHGSADHYNSLIDFVRRQSMESDEDYEYVKGQMDLDNYIDYQIAQIYLSANDWPGNNIKFWRADSGPYDRWRWIIYDLDNCFFYIERNTLELATDPNCDCGWPNPPWSTTLFRRLLRSEHFRNDFVQRYAFHMNTTFNAARVHYYIDSMKGNIAAEIPRHITRWGGQTVPEPEHWIGPTFNSMEEWQHQIDRMKQFVSERRPHARQHVMDYFRISGMAQITLFNNQPQAGIIKIADQQVKQQVLSGKYFMDIPLEIKAISTLGYRFSHWEHVDSEGNTQILKDQVLTIIPEEDFALFAHFELSAEVNPVIVINEINYHSPEGEDSGDWVELYNRKAEIVDLSGWILKDENDQNVYRFPDGFEIGPNGYHVICEDIVHFKLIHRDVDNVIGNTDFGFNNGGEIIRLFNRDEVLIDAVEYDDESPWPVEADGMGPTLELLDPDLSNDLAENWVASYENGTPGRQNFSNAIEAHDLSQNYPNPTSSTTTIAVSIDEPGFLRIQLYDIFGRYIATLVNEFKEKAEYQISYDVRTLPTGMYLYTMSVDNQLVDTKKMVVIQ